MTESELLSLAREVAPRLDWTPQRGSGFRKGVPTAYVGEDWFLLLNPLEDALIGVRIFWGDHLVAAPSIYVAECEPDGLRAALVDALRFMEGRIASAQGDINRALHQVGA